MRKRVFGRKFNRDTNERKQLFRSLMRSFVLQGKLKTTETRIAAIRSEVEKMVTSAKRKGEAAERDLMKRIPDNEVVQRIIREIAPKFADRPGGYTRVLKLGSRVKDAAPVALMQWVEVIDIVAPSKEKKQKVETKEAEVSVAKEEKKAAKKSTKSKGK